MNGRYDGRYRIWRLGRLLFAVLAAVAIGAVAYNFGFSEGLSRAAAPAVAVAYPWHPWGFGFFPMLFFVLFSFFALRLLFWGVLGARAWRYGGWCGPGYGYGGGRPPMFDEWHRRAHERDREDRTVTSV